MATNKLADAQKNGLLTDTFWQKRLKEMIALLSKEMVFQNLGTKVTIPKNQGTTKTTHRRYLSLPVDLTKQKLAEGVAPESLKIEGVKVSGEVHQYGAWIKITDWVEDIHFDNILNIYQPELARHSVEVRERVVLASFEEASEAFVGGGTNVNSITSANVLTLQDLRNVQLKMRVDKRRPHPKYGRVVVVAGPQVMQDLLDDNDLLQKALLTGSENAPIKRNTLEAYHVYDLAFLRDTLMLAEPTANTAKTPVNIYKTVVLGADAYDVITMGDISWHKKDFGADSNDPLAQFASVGYKFWFGAKVTDAQNIYVVYSASKFDVSASSDDPYGKHASQA